MSIQEYFLTNKGHLDVYANNITAKSVSATQIVSDTNKIYQWNFNLAISPSASQTVNGIFSITGLGQGVLNIPSQATLDSYFGTTNKGIVFCIEVLNSTANALSVVNNSAIILNIPSGTLLNPSYNKYYFSKGADNGPYYCINNTPNII